MTDLDHGCVRVGGNAVFVRSLDLASAPALSEQALRELAATLDSDEQVRATRFAFPADRARFIVTRATVRRILASLLALAPAEVRYELGPFGKPSVARAQLGSRKFFFNVSNTRTVALVAWSSAELGVDVEDVDLGRPLDELGVARVVFTPREQAALATLPPGLVRRSAFCALWARKEAVLKALGTGFSRPAETIDLGLGLAELGPWDWIDPETQQRFVVADLVLDEAHKAAVASRAARF
jgi:4'-phosphopantetheinyl transferase